MTEGNTRYEQACRFLPNKWQAFAKQLPRPEWERVEEIRLRVGQPVTVLLPDGEHLITEDLRYTVTSDELEQLCDLVCGYSRYAVSRTLAQGYLTAAGGFRVGLCGTVVMSEEKNTNLRDISSAVIRIGRAKEGIAEPLSEKLLENGRFPGTLVISPPGGGKTTLLRDMIRCLSDGTGGYPACRVALADERGEVAGMYHSEPQFYVGRHTDILDGCPKAAAAEILVRAMNPQVIAMDEITADRDLTAMKAAANCGVVLLATIHGENMEELKRKPLFRKMLKAQVFRKAVLIHHAEECRRYEVIDL